MTIGPLQLVLVKFADEQRTAGIVEELKAVRKTGVIRLVDMLYVYKNMQGELQVKEASDLAEAQKAEYGLVLQGLLGMRAAHKTAGDVDKIAAAMSLSPGDFGLSSEQVQQMGQDLPNGGSAILILFEHVWAVRLKEALLNAGGQLIAQGLLSPEALALGGTTLEDAMAAAQKIEDEAELAAAAETAAAKQKLAEAGAEAQAKQTEAQRILAEAEAEAAARMEQARLAAAAAIAAGVRTAAGEMQQADEVLEQSKREAAQRQEQAEREAAQRLEQSKIKAAATVALGAGIASQTVQAGEQIAQQKIDEGIQTAEEIKSAAVMQALKILVEAQLIKREAARQAIPSLTAASLIQPAAGKDLFYLDEPSIL
jgi:uncharacterized membrane protein